MVKAKTTVLTVDRGGPRGFYVFWSTDGGVTWLTNLRRALRSEKQLGRYHKALAEEFPNASFERIQNPEGNIPKQFWQDGIVGTPKTVVDRVMMRRFASEKLQPKKSVAPSPLASSGPAFELKQGEVEGIEVRRGFNFRSLSVRIPGDRPTVKTLQEWQRFIKHLPAIQRIVEKFGEFVENSVEYRAKLEKVLKEVEKEYKEKMIREAEKRLKAEQN
jgi:hypothetical protein